MSAAAAFPPEFSAAAVEQLGRALRLYLSGPDAAGRETLLRLALERMCTEAHHARLGPERMLVAVKGVWARVSSPEQIDIERSRILLASVVESCIESYYEAPKPTRSAFVEEREQPRVV